MLPLESRPPQARAGAHTARTGTNTPVTVPSCMYVPLALPSSPLPRSSASPAPPRPSPPDAPHLCFCVPLLSSPPPHPLLPGPRYTPPIASFFPRSCGTEPCRRGRRSQGLSQAVTGCHRDCHRLSQGLSQAVTGTVTSCAGPYLGLPPERLLLHPAGWRAAPSRLTLQRRRGRGGRGCRWGCPRRQGRPQHRCGGAAGRHGGLPVRRRPSRRGRVRQC